LDAQEAGAFRDALCKIQLHVEESGRADASACVLILKELNEVLNISEVVLLAETFCESEKSASTSPSLAPLMQAS